VTRSSIQEIDPRAKFQREACIARGVHLSDNHDLPVAGHREMT